MSVKELDSAPNLTRLYGKAALGAATAPLTGGGGELPDTELVLGDVEVDREHLSEYNRVCGFRLDDELPPTYPHILAFPLETELMTESDFPFALVGLVHVANRIVQHRPIDASETLNITTIARDLRPHRKGQVFDVVAEIRSGDELVWTGESTYLRKGGGSGDAGAESGSGSDGRGSSAAEGYERPDRSATWKVPGNLGRRYAAVSGDRNPIHLHSVPARLFGFPRTIVHGMWTKARCLAALEGRLPDSLEVDVQFKLPLLLPSKVVFSSAQRDGRWDIAVHNADNDKPHLIGTVSDA